MYVFVVVGMNATIEPPSGRLGSARPRAASLTSPVASVSPGAVVSPPPGTVVALPTLPNAVTSANAEMETSGTNLVLRRIAAPSVREPHVQTGLDYISYIV